MLRPIIETAFREKQSEAELTTALKRHPFFTVDRAGRISAYEANHAFHQAVLHAFKTSGKVDAVRWITMGDDDVEAVCEENGAAGPIDADSGGSRPRIRDDVALQSDLISPGVPR